MKSKRDTYGDCELPSTQGLKGLKCIVCGIVGWSFTNNVIVDVGGAVETPSVPNSEYVGVVSGYTD